jgi:hypothetical protein
MKMVEERPPTNQLIVLGIGLTIAGIVMVPMVYLLSQSVPEYSWTGLYLAVCGVTLLGMVLIGVAIGMATSGSTISHRTEDPGTFAVRTTEAVYHYAPSVQSPQTSTTPPPTQTASTSQPPTTPPPLYPPK